MEGHLMMSKKERARLVMRANAIKSGMKISKASEPLGLSYRQTFRMARGSTWAKTARGDKICWSRFAIRWPSSWRCLMLTADRTRMLQVLANLLDNAIKYTPQGGRVEIGGAQVQGRVVLTVTDTGIGIPQEDLPKIWDRLFRGDRSRSQRGLGLGLSLVAAIVKAHRGMVEAANFGPCGARFTVSLPA